MPHSRLQLPPQPRGAWVRSPATFSVEPQRLTQVSSDNFRPTLQAMGNLLRLVMATRMPRPCCICSYLLLYLLVVLGVEPGPTTVVIVVSDYNVEGLLQLPRQQGMRSRGVRRVNRGPPPSSCLLMPYASVRSGNPRVLGSDSTHNGNSRAGANLLADGPSDAKKEQGGSESCRQLS